MGRARLGKNVVAAALERLETIYAAGHRVVVGHSGGKDSTVCLELAIIVARKLGRLPVEVVTQDEEIGFCGTYEHLERLAQRPEVKLTWLCMQQPMLNVFSRTHPYWWCHDPELPRSDWVRQPPAYAQFVPEKGIELIVTNKRYPVEYSAPSAKWDSADKRQRLVAVIGLRTQESVKRLLGLFSSKGPMTAASRFGTHYLRPIYDWTEGDVWRFIKDTKADYNHGYDTLYRMGVTRNLRMGPPTMTLAGLHQLQTAARAWPAWFDRVCSRVPGSRLAVAFGRRAVSPRRRVGESWEQCFYRECLGPDAPEWVRERAGLFLQKRLQGHGKHSTAPYPEVEPCHSCGLLGTWKSLVTALYGGDPYGLKTWPVLPFVDPEFFRPGSGVWGSRPGF